MKLTEKLVTLIIMAAKTCGLNNAENTISYIEEQLTGEEHDAVLGFFKWCIETGNKFGHGNIEQRWKEYQSVEELTEDRTFGYVELHIAPDSTFVRRFGKKVKQAGGTYSAARGSTDWRCVTLPVANIHLIDAIVLAFPYTRTRTPMVARNFVDNRFNRLPSWVSVHNYAKLSATPSKQPMEFLFEKVDEAITSAFERGLVHQETAVEKIQETFGDLGTQVKPLPIDPEKASLIEFGYKCCEKGMNIQKTMIEFALIMQEEKPSTPWVGFLKALAKLMAIKDQGEGAERDLLRATQEALKVETDEKRRRDLNSTLTSLEIEGVTLA